MSLDNIEKLTRDYAHARRILADRVEELEKKISDLKKRALPMIRKCVEATAHRHAELAAVIERSPQLFKKQRTIIFHGIKVGFQKGKGMLKWESPDMVVKLIRKQFPDQADTLIRISEVPLKSALAQLSAAELKKLTITVVETGDQVVIKGTDSEIDKLVAALLKEDDPAMSSGLAGSGFKEVA